MNRTEEIRHQIIFLLEEKKRNRKINPEKILAERGYDKGEIKLAALDLWTKRSLQLTALIRQNPGLSDALDL
jgi:hypothetical protein